GPSRSDAPEIRELGVIVPEPRFVISEQWRLVARQAVHLIANFPNRKQGAIHGKVRAVMFDFSNGRIAVVNAAHDISAFGRPHLEGSAPGCVGVSGHAWRVEKNAHGIAIKTVLHEKPVVRGNEKIVARGDTTEPDLEVVLKELLLVSQVDQ